VIRLLKEILQQTTISNYLTQLTNTPIRNISLAQCFSKLAESPQARFWMARRRKKQRGRNNIKGAKMLNH